MNIVRLTRHKASEKQLAELERIFGDDVIVTQVSETLPNNSRKAVTRFDEITEDADVVEAVLPINLLQAVLNYSTFCEEGGMVIRAITNREVDEDGETTFTFEYYEEMKEVNIVTERL